MAKSLGLSMTEIEEIYRRNVNTIYRVCFNYMKNSSDSQDAVSDTFLNMIKSKTSFENHEHEKAWLIRTASNVCINILKSHSRKNSRLVEYKNFEENKNIEIDHCLDAVLKLADKYKTPIYLYYYEGYNAAEISKILQKPHSTIRSHLSEARAILRSELGDDFNEQN